jgi:hypothetical protein
MLGRSRPLLGSDRPPLLFRSAKRSSVRRSPAFWGAPVCTRLGHRLFFSALHNRSSVHRSRQFGSGVHARYAFAFLKICAAVSHSPAVWGASGSFDHMCLLSGHEDNKTTYKERSNGNGRLWDWLLSSSGKPPRRSRAVSGAPERFDRATT